MWGLVSELLVWKDGAFMDDASRLFVMLGIGGAKLYEKGHFYLHLSEMSLGYWAAFGVEMCRFLQNCIKCAANYSTD